MAWHATQSRVTTPASNTGNKRRRKYRCPAPAGRGYRQLTMRIELMNPGFEGHVLEVETGGLRAEPSVFFDGARAAPRMEPGSFLVHQANGTEANIVVRRSPWVIDPIPRVTVDGQRAEIRGRPSWPALLWAGLPLLFALFGPVPGVVGVVAALGNYRIVRLPGGFGRWWRALMVTIAAGALVIGVMFASLGLTGATQTAAGEHAVQRVHALLDAGDGAQIVTEADPLFTSKSSAAVATQFFHDLHAAFGAVQSSSLNTWMVNQQLTTDVSATFLRMDYRTQFAAGPATETFTWRIDGDRMLLAGYHIDSAAVLP
jgi:hypothetical protein